MAFESLEILIDVATVTGIGIVWFYFKDALKMYFNISKLQIALLKQEANDLRYLRNGREAPPAYSPPLNQLKTD